MSAETKLERVCRLRDAVKFSAEHVEQDEHQTRVFATWRWVERELDAILASEDPAPEALRERVKAELRHWYLSVDDDLDPWADRILSLVEGAGGLRAAVEQFIRERGRHEGEHDIDARGCSKCERAYVEAEGRLDATLSAKEEDFVVDSIPPGVSITASRFEGGRWHLTIEREDGLRTPSPPAETGLYNELIYAVQNKVQGETRHQTALRIIREHEESLAQSANREGGPHGV